MNRGYIKVWRKIEDSPIWQDPILHRLFMWCLLRASYKPRTVSVKTGKGITLVDLTEGQFIFGRNEASAALKIPASTIRDKLKRLITLQVIHQEPATHWSIITVINWSSYQGDDISNPPPNPPPNRHPTATQPPPNRHKQEVKEVKEGEEGKEREKTKDKNSCSEPAASEPDSPVVMTIDAIGGVFEITQARLELWEHTYPNVEVVAHIKRAAAWLDANPKKRKTVIGMPRFLNGWLAKEQDRPKPVSAKPSSNLYLELAQQYRENGE